VACEFIAYREVSLQTGRKMKACVVLNPNASKRLIAKGVASLPVVREGLSSGTVVITLGTTNAFVAEELTGKPVDRSLFAAGFVDDRWNVNAQISRAREIVLRRGEPVEVQEEELLRSLGRGDVVIKGGNALDPWGTVGVLLASSAGGTVGRYLSRALARGVDIVIPIGLEKTIHAAVADVAQELGSGRLDLSMGLPCGMQPLVGHVVTEIDALETLFAVEAMQIAAGGIGRGAGSVSLLIRGEAAAVQAAFALVASLQHEPEVRLEGST
jgi:hypothetical protein